MGKLCQLLEISRSGYYAWLNRGVSNRTKLNQAILCDLIYLHEKYPALGLDGLHQMLKPKFHCSRGRVHRLMKAHNIHSSRKKAYKATTDSKHNNPVSPNLLNRNFSFDTPNQAWVGDITYIPTDQGWLYLAIVKDLCTKKVIGYAFSDHINTELTLAALDMACKRQKPPHGLIFHSDRGVQYASKEYRKRLLAYHITQSMSRKGDPYDNAVAENFFSCLKCELVHLKHYETRVKAEVSIFSYIETFYNKVRPHSALGGLSPSAFEQQLIQFVA